MLLVNRQERGKGVMVGVSQSDCEDEVLVIFILV